jgi:Zn-dependent protease with chaperone function
MTLPLAPGASDTRPEPGAQAAAALDKLLSALPDAIDPVPRSWGFRLRLALALFVLSAVSAVYMALVVVTSYGVWSHFASDALVTTVRGLFGGLGAYLAFRVAGPILCVFLVKPIFTLRRVVRPALTLERTAEPRLFAYVERLCRAQRAPAPRQIRVNTDINASAGLRRGLISLLGNDLVLTVGLPLVRAMTLRELTGVLAHEFGHFAQGGAMRLTYLIRTASGFMFRVAHERDGFDALLIELSRFRVIFDLRVTIVLWLFAAFMLGVQLFLWLARALMKGLAWVALAASAALLREMEYDADRHEARVAGSEAFSAVALKLAVLGAGRQAAWSLQARWWESRRLADDVPALVMAIVHQLDAQPDVLPRIRQSLEAEKTGWFDTHPAHGDRLASVARDAVPGVMTLDAPASVLFNDLEGLCQRATLAEYRDAIGDAVQSSALLPVAELLNRSCRIRRP